METEKWPKAADSPLPSQLHAKLVERIEDTNHSMRILALYARSLPTR